MCGRLLPERRSIFLSFHSRSKSSLYSKTFSPAIRHSFIHSYSPKNSDKTQTNKDKVSRNSMERYIGGCFFFSIHAVTDISATVGIKFCMMVQDKSSPLLGAVPQIRNFGPKLWPFDPPISRKWCVALLNVN